jgi:hypothetical protein
MSQSANGFAIPNEPGSNFRADVNAALQQLATDSSGATAPAVTYPYMRWYDTANSVLKIRNGANSAWVINGPYGDSTQNILYTNNLPQTYTDPTGATGFGVATPTYKVDVQGDINARGNMRVNGVIQTVAGHSTIASAGTTDLGSTTNSGITISGSTAITSFGSTATAGIIKFVTLGGSITLTYNATSLITPTNANINGVAGDTFTAEALGSGNWRILTYTSGSTGGAVIAASMNGGQLAGLRNKVINGDMRIDQVLSGAATTPTASGVVLVDRWKCGITQSSKLTFQQVADAPPGFKFSQKITVASQYSPIAADAFNISQSIEGQNIVDLGFGTASPATITVSLWVKGSVAGNYSAFVTNGSRSYIGIVPVTTTWARQFVTLIADSTGTWATDNTVGLALAFDLGSGSNYNGTAGAWAAGNFSRTTGTVTFVNQTAGATLNITGVQLEIGTQATPFEQRPYGMEYSMVQRYRPVWGAQTSGGAVTIAIGQCITTTQATVFLQAETMTRIDNNTLTFSALGDFRILSASGTQLTPTAITANAPGPRGIEILVVVASGLVAGQACLFRSVSSAARIVGTTSEL